MLSEGYRRPLKGERLGLGLVFTTRQPLSRQHRFAMILGALIQHWLCYRWYPESRYIAPFQRDKQVADLLAAKTFLGIALRAAAMAALAGITMRLLGSPDCRQHVQRCSDERDDHQKFEGSLR
jgi:hypothetical protein